MSEHPLSPPTPAVGAARPADADDGRVLVTTTQLAARLEDAVGCGVDESDLEALLLELDRHGYVDWVSVTRDGDYCWDLTDSPDRIAAAVGDLVAERVADWLERRAGL